MIAPMTGSMVRLRQREAGRSRQPLAGPARTSSAAGQVSAADADRGKGDDEHGHGERGGYQEGAWSRRAPPADLIRTAAWPPASGCWLYGQGRGLGSSHDPHSSDRRSSYGRGLLQWRV